jgi:hypothetical protein
VSDNGFKVVSGVDQLLPNTVECVDVSCNRTETKSLVNQDQVSPDKDKPAFVDHVNRQTNGMLFDS